MAAASLVMCALVAYFFLFGYSLTCSSFWNCQFGDLGYVCLGGLLFFFFFSLWLFSHVLQFFWNCQLLDLGYVCFSLAILSHALVFWNCQFGDLGYVCFGSRLSFFSLSLSLSLWLFSHAIQLFWNSQFGEPFQVHKIFQAFQILGI